MAETIYINCSDMTLSALIEQLTRVQDHYHLKGDPKVWSDAFTDQGEDEVSPNDLTVHIDDEGVVFGWIAWGRPAKPLTRTETVEGFERCVEVEDEFGGSWHFSDTRDDCPECSSGNHDWQDFVEGVTVEADEDGDVTVRIPVKCRLCGIEAVSEVESSDGDIEYPRDPEDGEE